MHINFKFSAPYERAWHRGEETYTPPSEVLIQEKIQAIDSFWEKNNTKIKKELKKVTGLSFKKETIPCYLNTVVTLSEPLSLKIVAVEDMQDNLIHELIHILITQNKIGLTEGWKQLHTDFEKEHVVARNHILIHAIHLLLYQSLYPDRIPSIIEYSGKLPYIRSWEIVEEIGAQALLDTYLL